MLPAHLKRYVVEQDYSRYTPVDQAVWRYIMRQLTAFLSKHAHPSYLDGLAKTGIEVDRIPEISKMSEKLEKFGWTAVPVSGFIPPAAFMELQAHGVLPIASDLRTIDHLLYTPAPDIVHEAAGHAPILIDPEYAAYLKAYAQVASKAIISCEDMDQYEAIRVLSDMKEDPNSTPEQIQEAEKKLSDVSAAISHLSEAALLGRMNWWTAEYGLIGSTESPRIFGAGLLSSIGEARSCLEANVKKIPLSIDCINYAYDITEPQPQLFVTPDFQHLHKVLEELAAQMAFNRGGIEGLEKARSAQTVNTVELDSGLQISGKLIEVLNSSSQVSYLRFDGPTQLSLRGNELKGHGKDYHAHGFGTPLGDVVGLSVPLMDAQESQLAQAGIREGERVDLKFTSGVRVVGKLKSSLRDPSNRKLLVMAFTDCTVTSGDRVLFEPAWGTFDMAVGRTVPSVFGGPADRAAYGETEDFVAKVIPRKVWSPIMKFKHEIYQSVRDLRADLESGRLKADKQTSGKLESLYARVEEDFPHDWLIRLEILELSGKLPSEAWRGRVEIDLQRLSESEPEVKARIEDGIRVFH